MTQHDATEFDRANEGLAATNSDALAGDHSKGNPNGEQLRHAAIADSDESDTHNASSARSSTTDLALIAVFAAFVAACSVIAIPIGAAPITLQTFAVLLSGAVLGASRGFFAVLLYLALGAIGLPIFAGGMAGLAPFAGPTVGYLASFPLAALVTGLLVQVLPRRSVKQSTLVIFTAALASTLFITYPLGIAGMAWRAGLTLGEAFMVNLAFIPLDLVKIVLAAIVATAVHRAFPMLLPLRLNTRPGTRTRRGSGSRSQSKANSNPTPKSDTVSEPRSASGSNPHAHERQ